jgi:diphthamide biosynthesis protein 7
MLFTGGEDGKLRLLSLASSPMECSSKLSVSERPHQLRTFHPHEYGVTFILPLPVYSTDTPQCFLLTGGYDDYIRVFTTHDSRSTAPKMGKPQVLAELKIEGAGWRLQFLENYWCPGSSSTSLSKENTVSSAQIAPYVFRVLASCHVAGAKILEITGSLCGDWAIRELGNVTIHDSMCYASGVVPTESKRGETINPSLPRICVSTSWEDRLLCVWEWYPEGRKEREF